MNESPIFTRAYDLLRWLIPLTVRFPRQQRFVLAGHLQQTALAFQDRIIEAAKSRDPAPVLRDADTTLAKLRLYFRLCRDLGLITPGQYEHGAKLMAEVGRLLGGWIRGSEARDPV
jgi:hypothetical protein